MEDNYHFKVIGNHGWQLSPGKRHCDVSFTCSQFHASNGSPVSGILVPTDVKLIYHTIYFSTFQETVGSSDDIDLRCVKSHVECQRHTGCLSAFIHYAHYRL